MYPWLNSYTDNTYDFVQINNLDYCILRATCGFPHVSVLGPKLFIAYCLEITCLNC